ncbi:hypothetical protein AC249_AIPGENE14002 [Exaiptasia diaphana]|nr:hypothetical protein AC249_AIPGENE14002 [Exaiptasia diaphana]
MTWRMDLLVNTGLPDRVIQFYFKSVLQWPSYKEIDAVLCCRDMVALQHVVESEEPNSNKPPQASTTLNEKKSTCPSPDVGEPNSSKTTQASTTSSPDAEEPNSTKPHASTASKGKKPVKNAVNPNSSAEEQLDLTEDDNIFNFPKSATRKRNRHDRKNCNKRRAMKLDDENDFISKWNIWKNKETD